MKVNNMDKYELTNAIEKVRKVINNPETNLHFNSPSSGEFLKDVEEINNPVTDKDGYVHKYYLSDDAKSLIEILLKER